MKASGVGDRGEDATAPTQPAFDACQDRDRVIDVLEHMTEHDVVEGSSWLVLFEQAAFHVDSGVAPGERRAESRRAIDAGEIVEVLHKRGGRQAFCWSELQA